MQNLQEWETNTPNKRMKILVTLIVDQNCNEWKIKTCCIDIENEHWADSVKLVEEDSSEDSESDTDSLKLPEIANVRQEPKRWLDHYTTAVKKLIKANGGKPLTSTYLKKRKDSNKHVR